MDVSGREKERAPVFRASAGLRTHSGVQAVFGVHQITGCRCLPRHRFQKCSSARMTGRLLGFHHGGPQCSSYGQVVCKLVSAGDKPFTTSRKGMIYICDHKEINKLTLTWIFVCFTATDWVVANEEPTQANLFCIKNLTTGDLLHVRVVAVNPGGRSEAGTLPQPVPIREVVGERSTFKLSPHQAVVDKRSCFFMSFFFLVKRQLLQRLSRAFCQL